MATNKKDAMKAAPAEQSVTAEPVVGKPTAEMVTQIACALLQSPRYSLKLRDRKHQEDLVAVAIRIAETITTALK